MYLIDQLYSGPCIAYNKQISSIFLKFLCFQIWTGDVASSQHKINKKNFGELELLFNIRYTQWDHNSCSLLASLLLLYATLLQLKTSLLMTSIRLSTAPRTFSSSSMLLVRNIRVVHNIRNIYIIFRRVRSLQTYGCCKWMKVLKIFFNY